MANYPVPNKPGFYWAKLINPAKMPLGEDWISFKWEIVDVWENYGEGDETLAVHVPGIEPTQWLPNFIWGPEVVKPKELK